MKTTERERERERGFTLVELSIALVIIGLIVGGVLVGRDLIHSAELRSEVSQIEKYQTAVNTFKLKYNALPGDIAEPNASAFGFAARGYYFGYNGKGDGDGIIEGWYPSWAQDMGYTIGCGESPMVWVDLSKAGLIEGSFTAGNPINPPATAITGSGIDSYFPQAKIGGGNYVYVWSHSNEPSFPNSSFIGTTAGNYFGISAVTSIGTGGGISSSRTIPVKDAYNIDSKIDDGIPRTGNVIAAYVTNYPQWTNGNSNAILFENPNMGAIGASSTTCFDNGNTSGEPVYSIRTNSGNGLNCALSFKMK